MGDGNACGRTADAAAGPMAAYGAALVLRDEVLATARLVRQDLDILARHEAVPNFLDAALASLASDAPAGRHDTELATLAALLAQGEPSQAEAQAAIRAWHDGLVNLAHHLRGAGNYAFDRLQRLHRVSDLTLEDGPCPLPAEDTAKIKTVNAVTADLELLNAADKPVTFPKFLIVDPTNSCNFRCRTCFQSVDQTFHHAQLQPRVLARLLSILPFVDEVKLFGTGEPTLARDLPGFVAMAHGYGCRTDVLTNGSTLSKRPIPLEHLTRLGLSIDGAEARTFQAIRVGMPFNLIVQGLRDVRRRAPTLEIYLNVTLSRANLDEIEALTRLAVEIGVNELQWNQIHAYMPQLQPLALRASDRPLYDEQMRRSVKLCEQHGIAWRSDISFAGMADDGEIRDKERLLAYLEAMQFEDGSAEKRDIDQMRRAFADFPFHWQPPALAYGLPPRPATLPALPPQTSRRPDAEELICHHDQLFESLAARASSGEAVRLPYCTAPWTRLYVESTGQVRPCCVYTGHLGDLTVSSLEEVWHGEPYIALRQAMFDTARLPPPCRGCMSSERYHYLDHAVVLLERAGIASSQLEVPDDFHPPARLLAQMEMLAQSGTWRAKLLGLRRRLQSIAANFTASDDSLAAAYWTRYPDVHQSVEYGMGGAHGTRGARLHYTRHGRREGRIWGL